MPLPLLDWADAVSTALLITSARSTLSASQLHLILMIREMSAASFNEPTHVPKLSLQSCTGPGFWLREFASPRFHHSQVHSVMGPADLLSSMRGQHRSDELVFLAHRVARSVSSSCRAPVIISSVVGDRKRNSASLLICDGAHRVGSTHSRSLPSATKVVFVYLWGEHSADVLRMRLEIRNSTRSKMQQRAERE